MGGITQHLVSRTTDQRKQQDYNQVPDNNDENISYVAGNLNNSFAVNNNSYRPKIALGK